MKTIWLIRHAESTANVGKKTATPETIGLTEAGKEQANRLADYISNMPDLIITSPFIRTLHTARGVSRQQKWHRLTPLVRGGAQVFSCMQENT